MKRGNLLNGVNILPNTWTLRIKQFQDDKLREFKVRFCVPGDWQVKGVDYFEKYVPVVSWLTVRMLLVMSLNLG